VITAESSVMVVCPAASPPHRGSAPAAWGPYVAAKDIVGPGAPDIVTVGFEGSGAISDDELEELEDAGSIVNCSETEYTRPCVTFINMK